MGRQRKENLSRIYKKMPGCQHLLSAQVLNVIKTKLIITRCVDYRQVGWFSGGVGRGRLESNCDAASSRFQCHGQDCSSWAGSKHAHAWQTLTERGYHVDSYCQHCHTTGFGLPGGFESATKAGQLHSVGCESCHGPSHVHAKNPKVRTMFAAKDQCATCHDRENSPTFQYDTFWPKMRHGEPAMPPKGASQ